MYAQTYSTRELANAAHTMAYNFVVVFFCAWRRLCAGLSRSPPKPAPVCPCGGTQRRQGWAPGSACSAADAGLAAAALNVAGLVARRAEGGEALGAAAGARGGRVHRARVRARALHRRVPVEGDHVVRSPADRAALALRALQLERGHALDVGAAQVDAGRVQRLRQLLAELAGVLGRGGEAQHREEQEGAERHLPMLRCARSGVEERRA